MSAKKFESHSTGSNFLETSQSIFKQINFPLAFATVALLVLGGVTMYSASLTISDASFIKQLFGMVLGLIAAALIMNVDVKKASSFTHALLIIDIILLISPLLPVIGVYSKGINGWVQIPGIGLRFQPAELAKLVTILLMASLVSQYNGKITSLKDYIKLCAILGVPFILILLQPDLGTGLILLVVGAVIIIMGGPKRKWVLITIALVVGLVAIVLITDPIIDATLGDSKSLLKEYQMNRLLVFVDPTLDPSGSGYNLQQSKIAVGSGGLFGKGIGQASQAGGGFLPEAHTDFVFALFAEEFGFVGVIVLLALFFVLIITTLYIGFVSRSMFGALTCVGIAVMWTFQLLQNMGMCMGIMPITGIPLPFISYGSSSMLAQLMAVGIVGSIYKHRS